MVTFPRFYLPGILFDDPLSKEITTNNPPYFTFTTSDSQGRAESIQGGSEGSIAWSGGKPFAFARVLAHVAYGFYVANYGIPEHSPLRAIIMGEDECLSHWVGGTTDDTVVIPPPTPNATLHEVSGIYYLIDGVEYFTAQIRMFAYLQPTPPVYSVVVTRREIPRRNTYFAFTRDKAADRVFIEGPISRV